MEWMGICAVFFFCEAVTKEWITLGIAWSEWTNNYMFAMNEMAKYDWTANNEYNRKYQMYNSEFPIQ